MTRLGLVWAEAHGVIGFDGGMPWHLPEDLKHFRAVTGSDPVVMGRRTWESLPDRFRPLPGRANIVVTRQSDWATPGAQRAGSLEQALCAAGEGAVWVIGGGELYRAAIGLADTLEVTEIDLVVQGDAFAPARDGFTVVAAGDWQESAGGLRYRFLTLERDPSTASAHAE